MAVIPSALASYLRAMSAAWSDSNVRLPVRNWVPSNVNSNESGPSWRPNVIILSDLSSRVAPWVVTTVTHVTSLSARPAATCRPHTAQLLLVSAELPPMTQSGPFKFKIGKLCQFYASRRCHLDAVTLRPTSGSGIQQVWTKVGPKLEARSRIDIKDVKDWCRHGTRKLPEVDLQCFLCNSDEFCSCGLCFAKPYNLRDLNSPLAV